MTDVTINIEARYPDLKRAFRQQCTREFTEHQMATIKGVIRMATIPAAVERSIARFVVAAQRQQRIVMVYLYGSHVKGTATDWSDIDLAIVSPDFVDRFEARVALLRLAAGIDDHIEPHPFTPDEFTIDDPLVSEIRQTGVRLMVEKPD